MKSVRRKISNNRKSMRLRKNQKQKRQTQRRKRLQKKRSRKMYRGGMNNNADKKTLNQIIKDGGDDAFKAHKNFVDQTMLFFKKKVKLINDNITPIISNPNIDIERAKQVIQSVITDINNINTVLKNNDQFIQEVTKY